MFENLINLIMGGMLDATEWMPEGIRVALCWGAYYVYLAIVVVIMLILATVVACGVIAIAMRTPLRPFIVEKLGFDTVKSLKEYKRRKRNKRK